MSPHRRWDSTSIERDRGGLASETGGLRSHRKQEYPQKGNPNTRYTFGPRKYEHQIRVEGAEKDGDGKGGEGTVIVGKGISRRVELGSGVGTCVSSDVWNDLLCTSFRSDSMKSN